MWRSGAAAVLSATLAVACSAPSDQAADSSTTLPTDEEDPAPADIAPTTSVSRNEPLSVTFTPTGVWSGSQAEQEGVETAPPDVLACRWRWFDDYELVLSRAGSDLATSTVPMSLVILQSDVGNGIAAGELELTGSGSTAISLTADPPPLEKETVVFRGDWLAPQGATCEVDFFDGGRQTLPLEFDPRPPDSAQPDGTVQALIGEIDDMEAPVLPLANLLYRLNDEPPFDRIYLAPDLPMGWISLDTDGSCIELQHAYVLGPEVDGMEPQVNVVQRRGCQPTDLYASSTTVSDANWEVLVYDATGNGDVARVVEALRRYDVEGVPAVNGPPQPGPDDWFEAFYADHPDVVELHRFPWRDGFVAVVERTNEPEPWRYQEPVIYWASLDEPGPAGAGFGVTGCFEYTIGSSAGFAWFVAADPSTRFVLTLDGVATEVPLVAAASGESVGLIDVGDAAVVPNDIAVLGSDGQAIACTQN